MGSRLWAIALALALLAPQPAMAASLGLAPIRLADDAGTLPEDPPDSAVDAPKSTFGQLPLLAAGLSFFVPGLGHVAIGEPREGAIAFLATATPLALGLAEAPPVIFADLPEHAASLWLLTAQEVWSMQTYMAYMAARKQIGNAGYPQPYRDPSVLDLVAAPFKPANLLDWRVWLTVLANVASGIALETAMPDPPSPETPFVFDARYAEVGGRRVPVGVGYGLHLAGSVAVSAHAGIGEEVLFRGVVQDEAERYLGRPLGLMAASGLFGLVHVGGINQTSAAKQFLATGLGGMYLGGLYIATDYDLEKAIAAHTYYDIVAFGLSGLFPETKGNNVFGIRYKF